MYESGEPQPRCARVPKKDAAYARVSAFDQEPKNQHQEAELRSGIS
jgi:hypothetical protein